VVVTLVTEDGAGAKAGIRINDVILEVNGGKSMVRGSFRIRSWAAPGTKVTLTVARKGATLNVSAILGSRPLSSP